MIFDSYNRYKYHHKILKVLRDNKVRYNEASANTRHEINYRLTSIEFSEKFKITTDKSIEILTELRDAKLIGWNKHNDEYRILDLGFRYVKLNHFKNLNSKYQYEWSTRILKDGLIIIMSIISIFTFLRTVYKNDSKKIEQLQLEYKEVKQEQKKLLKLLNEVKYNQLKVQNDTLIVE